MELARAAAPDQTRVHRVVSDVPIRDHQTCELSLEIVESTPIGSLRVDVNIEHSYRGDLRVRLRPPATLQLPPISLHEWQGRAATNLRRIYDEATTPALSGLRGLDPNGRWTLEVSDRATRDEGQIAHFGLELDG